MTIEERAYKDWGETFNPELACWMTTDGRMLNGSSAGYIRERDHRDISFYYKKSIREDPGSSQIYLRKFENRGNIRMGCSDHEYCLEISKTPTTEQIHTMRKIARAAERMNIPCTIVKRIGTLSNYHTRTFSFEEYLLHIEKYTELNNFI